MNIFSQQNPSFNDLSRDKYKASTIPRKKKHEWAGGLDNFQMPVIKWD
jgi:hypothetical protein